jgi:hypothetical protein
MRRIFTPHDNDLGVWVCNVVLFPTWKFMQAISNDESFAHVDVRFGHISHDRRKYFLKDQALPLVCWDCGETPDGSNRWQLFAIGEAGAGTFIRECDLNNLQFPVPMAGIILIADNYVLEKPRRSSYFEFGWATNQNLPLVIAAVGYAEPEFSLEAFRERFGLDVSIPVISGPALRWEEKPGVDPEFARRVLDALHREIRARS